LHQYFQQFGEVVDANLKINPATNQSRGFGFILFKEQAAVDRVNLTTFYCCCLSLFVFSSCNISYGSDSIFIISF